MLTQHTSTTNMHPHYHYSPSCSLKHAKSQTFDRYREDPGDTGTCSVKYGFKPVPFEAALCSPESKPGSSFAKAKVSPSTKTANAASFASDSGQAMAFAVAKCFSSSHRCRMTHTTFTMA